jgi:AcrR family transcriptional regulator
MATAPGYHHGDLRAALLDAALETIARDGVTALSLRALARKAGVSPMAPYHHFADRAELLAAVAESGFRRLYAEKLAALAASDGSAEETLVAGTRAYVVFILDNPALYRLMKSADLADRSPYPDLRQAAELPSARLAEMIAELAARGRLTTMPPADVGRVIWAFAHGLGLLAIDGYVPGDRDAVLALAEAGARALVAGFAG